MKIGILTQPLQDNYGGLLQAYALKEVLQEMGHEVININRKRKASFPWWKYASIVKSILIGRRIHPNLFLKQSDKLEISRETKRFRDRYFPNLTELITDEEGMRNLNNMGFDAYIVGSDQCWRPRYSPAIQNFFLDFVADNSKAKRIAYAASFGVSEWELTSRDTKKSKELLKKFDAISVREDSAIDLIKYKLGRNDAVHLIDPTMLLSTDQYKKIVDEGNLPPSPGNLKVYVLDKTKEKDDLVCQIEKHLQLKIFEVLPKKRLNEEKVVKENIDEFVYPHPAAWLQGFQDAKFVVTDSFHGTVFSILHNIPFVAIANKNRGLSRFESLLKMFELEDRLIFSSDDLDIQNIGEIDWDKVNNILSLEKDKAIRFLSERLNIN